jgi:hypothetical protein
LALHPFGLSLAFLFVIHVMVLAMRFFIEFFVFVVYTNGILGQQPLYLHHESNQNAKTLFVL